LQTITWWLAMNDSEQSVFLDNLPSGLVFPNELASRIRYDAGGRRLFYRGFMSKANFDMLHGLSDDGGYQVAIERLFELSVPGNHGGRVRGGVSRWLLAGLAFAAGIGLAAAVGLKIWN
jgi:hypothetical protein